MVFQISEASGIGEARRAAAERARHLGYDEKDTGRLSIIVNEIGSNILKHAKSGQIVIQDLPGVAYSGIELISLDNGPGHFSIERCMIDGYSTAGTSGNGLGAIKRLSDVFDIYSIDGGGTIVLSQVWPARHAPVLQANCPTFGSVSDPYPGEDICGDAFAIQIDSVRATLFVADGLGHGPLANDAARDAVSVFQRNSHKRTPEIIEAVHEGIRHTRGCAVSVAEVNLLSGAVSFCGIGNVSGCIIGGPLPKRTMVSLNGTAGHNLRKAKDFAYTSSANSIIVMHSDGIDTRWELSSFPRIEHRHPSVIAAALFRDHRRTRDDATVVVMKRGGEAS